MANKTSQKKPYRATHAHPIKLSQDLAHNSHEARIDIVPLIDVIFCILTFFILGAVGLSRQQAISLDLPKASTGTPQMREMLIVSVDDYGQAYVEQQPVTQNQLFETIKGYHQANPNGMIVLYASRNVNHGEVVQVLDILREVGGDRVALATLPGESNNNYLSPNRNLDNYNNWQQPYSTDYNQPPTNPSNPLLPGVPSSPDTTSGDR